MFTESLTIDTDLSTVCDQIGAGIGGDGGRDLQMTYVCADDWMSDLDRLSPDDLDGIALLLARAPESIDTPFLRRMEEFVRAGGLQG